MFAFKSLLLLALPLLVISKPLAARTDPTCNTGSLQCCNEIVSPTSPAVTELAGLVGVLLEVDQLVGLTCSPLTVIGLSQGQCTQQVTCCENNNFNGLIALGCNNISL